MWISEGAKLEEQDLITESGVENLMKCLFDSASSA